MGNVRPGRVIDAALRRKGFRCDSTRDHLFYYFDGTSIKTKISHGMMGSTVGVKLISDMAHQLHLAKPQFLALIDCPLDEEGYRNILRGQGFAV